MAPQYWIVIIGMCLILDVRLTAGEDTDGVDNLVVQSTPPIPEEVKSTEEPYNANVEGSDPVIDRSSYFHHLGHGGHYHHHGPSYHGFWKKKITWRPRWVKTWQEKKVYVAVWKRMWGPAMLNEWVPVPKPPPGWFRPNVAEFAIKTHHY